MPLARSMPGRRLIIVLAMWALRILAAAQPGVQPSDSQAAAPCLLTQELIEGPFYLDDKLFRSNITEGQPGIPLNLSISVVDSATCTPLPNALVDIWHCNAVGVYSGFEGNGASGVPPPPVTVRSPGVRGLKAVPTNNSTFLRGIGRAAADGVAVFQTIQPGWYVGRAPHIHVKVSAAYGSAM
jgi:protocatechuate 3,4-dioxygenase beta subunit